MRKKHLAIFSKDHIKDIFSGKKNIELRMSNKKIAPFGKVSIGDLVYIKPPGEDIVGQFIVKKVISIEGLEEEDWKLIDTRYSKKMSGEKKSSAKYATIIFIDQVEQFITAPVKIKKSDLRGWVVL